MAKFKPVKPNVNFPELEQEVINRWKENKTFEKSVDSRPENKTWTFLDGPPFITGKPHYGTLLPSILKDVYPRFWTMKGYKVRRVWGWDCHGLPAENKVEEKLNIKRKKDIEEVVGVKKFIEECKSYVQNVSEEWEWYIDHVGRWVDFKNAYKTMDVPYMESVMWVFKQMYDNGLVYKGLRVSLFCPHCSTPISNFEVAMDPDNYKELTEPANTYKYKLKGEDSTYLLAWSTTPWTKLVTPALAVNPNNDYVKVKQDGEYYVLAKNTTGKLNENIPYEVVEEFKGSDLVGKEFELHYDFYKVEESKKAGVIVGGDFVSEEDGTGVVTLAAYGEEDLEVMNKEGIQVALHLDEEGKFLPNVPNWAGQYYLDANEAINKDLEDRGLMYKEEQYTHTIPTCWRCHTRLIYAPQNAWYVNVQDLKADMKETNEVVNWFPSHFKYGRYLNSLEAAPDWCISRSRYWGSPVPVWECECGERFVPGSISELEERAGVEIKDLHKPEIDEVVVRCEKCGQDAHRVPEVLDSWIEAGSASFAERHFPFEEGVKLEDFFPPDFIVEYTGQIRAWFYVLHVISTALYKSPAFKNVAVTGVILGTDGRKMSKNFGNYPDPKELLEKYGGDALRLYLAGSPVTKGEDLIISEEKYAYQVRGFLLILWNVYNFFVNYADLSDWEPAKEKVLPAAVLDRWILSRLSTTMQDIQESLENYDSPQAISHMWKFVVEDLSGWYVRRSRDRISPAAENMDDKKACLQTLWTVLTDFSKVAAPLIPFVTEEIYTNLTGEESVHLVEWPKVEESWVNKDLEDQMISARTAVEKGHSRRKETNIPVRQPLSKLTVINGKKPDEDVLQLAKEELNVKEIEWTEGSSEFSVELDPTITPELEEEGKTRDLARSVQEQRKALGVSRTEMVNVTAPWIPEKQELVEWLKKRTLIQDLNEGPELKVERT